MQDSMKNIIQSFLESINFQKAHLINSQQALQNQLSICLNAVQNIETSMSDSAKKYEMIQIKMAKITTLQAKIDQTTKKMMEIHKRIQKVKDKVDNFIKKDKKN